MQQSHSKNRAVLFDLDGTLIDSFEPHLLAWEHCCERRGVAPGREVFVRTFGGKNDEIIPVYWREAGAASPDANEIRQIAEEKESIFRALAVEHFPAVVGSRELLHAVATAGWRTAIASNAPSENVRFCAREFHPHVFDVLVSGDMVARGKPDPGVFLFAAEQLGVLPARCVVIEDSPAGVEAARSAGMSVIALVTPAFEPSRLAGADAVVGSLPDINEELLGRLIEPNRQGATRQE